MGEIRTHDLTTDTPYNTYTRAGAAANSIALPGRESILAAVRPQETGEIYFVATGTGSGGHHFSKTLEEHNLAVKSYLEHLRAQQHGGAPEHGPGRGWQSERPDSNGGAWGGSRRRAMSRGRFITLEGIEGAGKSTVAQLVRERLAPRGYQRARDT